MNPFLVKTLEIQRKRSGKLTGPDSDHLLREFLKVAGGIRKWDEERKTAIKESNNDSISEISIKIDDDLVMLLCPRVKLIYNRKSGPILDPLEWACTLRSLFMEPNLSSKPVFIDLDDVRSNDNGKTVAVFVRDFSFIPPPDDSLPIYSKIAIARQFLHAQNLKTITIRYNYHHLPLDYELVASPPDDPNTLLHQFEVSHPGYMKHRRPMIVVHGLVSAFPSTSNKSTHLFQFFSFFGLLRLFDIQLDSVSIEYQVHDDFLVALNTLCCCSIRKDGCHKLFEFEVELKCPVGEEKEKEVGILETAKPKMTLEKILALWKQKAAGTSPKPVSKRKADSTPAAATSPRKRRDPTPPPEVTPAEVVPITLVPLETRSFSYPASASDALPEVVLRFPGNFGKSRSTRDLLHLDQMLLPGPRSVLEKRPLRDLVDRAVEHAFESLQVALFLQGGISHLEGDVCGLQIEKGKLPEQVNVAKEDKYQVQKELDSVRGLLLEESVQKQKLQDNLVEVEGKLTQALDAISSLSSEVQMLKGKNVS